MVEIEGMANNEKIYEDLLREDIGGLQSPSIKIIKNTKGYNFEFKVLSLDISEVDRVHNAIVSKINEWEGKSDEN